jgi:hypothetical protein
VDTETEWGDRMRRFGLYDTTRGLTTMVAAGTAGLLLWLATQVGQQTAPRFWASMGIVLAAGLIVALAQAIGGWTKGLRLRLSPGTFIIGFLPALVVAGWILIATQPGGGWGSGQLSSWSSSLGILDVVHDIGLWHGVLAFGLGLTLGLSLDTVPTDTVTVTLPARDDVVLAHTPETAPVDRVVLDEPVSAERDAAEATEPELVGLGRRDER